MVQELLPFIPQAISDELAAACVVAMCVGTFLWICGAAWSRGIIALLGVALGGMLGMLLPRWYEWPVNSMSGCVIGAVALGMLAFVLQRFGVGLVLGVALSLWVALAAWINGRGDQGWIWQSPDTVANMTVAEHAKDMWMRTPDPVRRPLPYGAGTVMMSALAISLLFPRLGRVMCFSALGVTIFFLATLTLVASRRPDWLIYVPPPPEEQAGILGIICVIGMVLQWQLLPRRRAAKVKPQEEDEKDQPLVTAPGGRKFA
jgi:hypothetical protein